MAKRRYKAKIIPLHPHGLTTRTTLAAEAAFPLALLSTNNPEDAAEEEVEKVAKVAKEARVASLTSHPAPNPNALLSPRCKKLVAYAATS